MILPQHDTVRSSGIFSGGGAFCGCRTFAHVEQDSIFDWEMYESWWSCENGDNGLWVLTQLEGLMTNHVMTWPSISMGVLAVGRL